MTSITPTSTQGESAEDWLSAVENYERILPDIELGWYESTSPSYSGAVVPGSTEAARRFVSNWLEVDVQGFPLPLTEWGWSLAHWLKILLAYAPDEMTPEVFAKISESSGSDIWTVEDTAENWIFSLEDSEGIIPGEELHWYRDESPQYSETPTPAQIEAARRFVSQWRNWDAHDFVIPAGEWGRSLMHWINVLVARRAPESEYLETSGE